MRTESKSALDFIYWVLESVEENYQAVGETAVFLPAVSGTVIHDLIIECAQVCEVAVPTTFSALMAKIDRYEATTSVETAFRRRGAVLHRNGLLYVSMGDGRRLVGADESGFVSLYRMSEAELEPSTWDGAFLIPEMVYM